MKIIQPEGWPAPKGFSNAILAKGRSLWVAGQVGWDAKGVFAPDLVGQVELTLKNIVAILQAGGARPEQIVRMDWFMTDLADYRSKAREIGAVYRAVIGRHFPAMTAVQVVALVEPKALVEIEVTAVLPD